MVYDKKTGKSHGSLYRRENSFSDIGQNLHIIARRLIQNEDLLKLLVHTEKDALNMPLTEKQKEEAFGKQIRIVPVIEKDEHARNYVIIQFSKFTPVAGVASSHYKSYFLSFDIICNMDNWMLDDYTPRPYKIMAEIEKEIGESKLSSLGPVNFAGAESLIVNEEMSGFTLIYHLTSEI